MGRLAASIICNNSIAALTNRVMDSFKGRITHLVSGDLWGGAEALVFALAQEQHRLRPGDVHCIVMNPGQLAARLIDSGIPTTTLDESRQGLRELLRAVGGVVRKFAPRIVHAHRQKENLLAALLAPFHFREGRAFRRVATIHGMPEPVRGGNVLRRSLINSVNALVFRQGLDAIVGVSQDIASRFQARFPRARVVAIHNGVAVPEHIGKGAGTHHERLRLLALGRLVPIKRFDRLGALSDALAGALASRPVITLAGDGPLHSELRELLKPDDPDGGFCMPGFVTDTSALLRETDGVIITSDHEGIPMAVLEALSGGVPVFGFHVGGLPEIAAPGVPLRLVPAGDVQELAREIVRFFTQNDPGVRTAPPPRWTFDIRECARAYGRLYASL
jgi:glycosyltransferase involved in cell wall biosynthesis